MANTVRCIRGSPPGTTEPAPRPGRAPAIGHTLVPAGALGFCDAPHRTFCGARLPRSAGVAAKVLLTGFSAHVGEAAALRSGDLFEACSGGRADTHGRRRSPPRILRCPAARVTATAITFGDATGLRRWVFVRHRPQATGHRARATGQGPRAKGASTCQCPQQEETAPGGRPRPTATDRTGPAWTATTPVPTRSTPRACAFSTPRLRKGIRRRGCGGGGRRSAWAGAR